MRAPLGQQYVEIAYATIIGGFGAQFLNPPAGEIWQPQSLFVQYTTDANAGNRNLMYEFAESALNTVFLQIVAGVVQITGLTRNYSAFQGAPLSAAFFATDQALLPMPPNIYLSGTNADKMVVFDKNGISATDQMNAVLQYRKFLDS